MDIDAFIAKWTDCVGGAERGLAVVTDVVSVTVR